MRLVLELCDRGSLRELLNKGGFKQPGSSLPDMAKVLETALDVARAMVHLHSENILHSDLKARNVLLKSGGGAGSARDFVAKVADFGLSIKMEAEQTHVSEVYQVGGELWPGVWWVCGGCVVVCRVCSGGWNRTASGCGQQQQRRCCTVVS